MINYLRKLFGLCIHQYVAFRADKRHRDSYKCIEYGQDLVVPARDWTTVHYKCSICKKIKQKELYGHYTLEEVS